MSVAKVTVSLESGLLRRVDHLVKARVFSNRSQAIQTAVQEKVARLDSNRLARECLKLDKVQEQRLADEGLGPLILVTELPPAPTLTTEFS